ncbi:MAG: hypothetical protein AB7G37_01035 [Solirubrobacteraceae bacterium]
MKRSAPAALVVALGALGFVGCGGSDSPPGLELEGAAIVRQASADEVKRWKGTWCNLTIGQAQADVRKAMGEPTQSFPDQDSWDGFGTDLTVFYDEEMRARQLQAGEQVGDCERTRFSPDSTTP